MKIRDVIIDMHQGINTVADKVVYLNSGIPIIQSKNFTKGYLDLEDVRYLDEEDEKKYKEKYNPHVGDIMMANIGTIGKSYVIKEEKSFLIAWNVFLIKPDTEKVMPDFLKFYFDYLASTHYFDRLLTGGTVKFINKKRIANINVPNKSLAEQEKICNILSQVEKIIILKQQEIKFLDDLTKARFVEMFGNNTYEEKSLSELAEVITKGTTPTTAGYKFLDEGINFFKIESINDNHTINLDKVAHIGEDCHNALKRSQLKEGDILFSIAGAIGRTAIIQGKDLPGNTNQALAIIRLRNDCNISQRFLISAFESPMVKEQYNKKKRGIAQINLSLQDIGKLHLIVPPITLQNQFADFVREVDKSRLVNFVYGLLKTILYK